MLLGAHTSVAGGLHRAIERSEAFNGTAVRIFSKNNNRWQERARTDEELAAWHEALDRSPIGAVAIHDSYLINLCSPDPATFARSYDAFVDEHRRAALLGVRLLNFHPGAAIDRDPADAAAIVAEQINRTHEETAGLDTISVIETTAGQGSTLGRSFQEIASIIERIHDSSRVGVCVDTCHVFAAGYDIGSEAGYNETFDAFGETIGLERLVLFHLNDSKGALGSHLDRHEQIGQGQIGEGAFRMVMNDERFREVPKVIETPKGPNFEHDVTNIALLRSFISSE